MDLKDIKVIVDLMKKNAVSEFEMEEGDFKIKLKRESGKPRKGETVVVQEAASDGSATRTGRPRSEVANDRNVLSETLAGC